MLASLCSLDSAPPLGGVEVFVKDYSLGDENIELLTPTHAIKLLSCKSIVTDTATEIFLDDGNEGKLNPAYSNYTNKFPGFYKPLNNDSEANVIFIATGNYGLLRFECETNEILIERISDAH